MDYTSADRKQEIFYLLWNINKSTAECVCFIRFQLNYQIIHGTEFSYWLQILCNNIFIHTIVYCLYLLMFILSSVFFLYHIPAEGFRLLPFKFKRSFSPSPACYIHKPYHIPSFVQPHITLSQNCTPVLRSSKKYLFEYLGSVKLIKKMCTKYLM
jgi:hypothetical protein